MNLSRRQFLVGTCACGVAAGLTGCMHYNSARLVAATPAGGKITVKLADAPELAKPGGAIKLKAPGDTILLWREGENTFHATSIVCTHRGCEVEVAEEGKSLVCPCHGSLFEADGEVRRGPAVLPLKRYPVDLRGDELSVTLPVS